jgi:hypothetical protein
LTCYRTWRPIPPVQPDEFYSGAFTLDFLIAANIVLSTYWDVFLSAKMRHWQVSLKAVMILVACVACSLALMGNKPRFAITLLGVALGLVSSLRTGLSLIRAHLDSNYRGELLAKLREAIR